MDMPQRRAYANQYLSNLIRGASEERSDEDDVGWNDLLGGKWVQSGDMVNSLVQGHG